MEDNSDLAELNQKQPMNSPSNPFASPTTGNVPDAKELLDTVNKMNENHKAQFSNLSNKYD